MRRGCKGNIPPYAKGHGICFYGCHIGLITWSSIWKRWHIKLDMYEPPYHCVFPWTVFHAFMWSLYGPTCPSVGYHLVTVIIFVLRMMRAHLLGLCCYRTSDSTYCIGIKHGIVKLTRHNAEAAFSVSVKHGGNAFVGGVLWINF